MQSIENKYIFLKLYNVEKALFVLDKRKLNFNDNVTLMKNKFGDYFLAIFFNDIDYISIKNKMLSILKEENVYFDVLFVKYKKNNYSISFFEQFFNDSNINVFEDIIFTLFVINNYKSYFFFVFLMNLLKGVNGEK